MTDLVTAETLLQQAHAAYKAGQYLAAAHDFVAASRSLELRSEALAAAEAANDASVAYLQSGEAAQALAAVENTPAVFAAAGDVHRQGLAWGNLGAALDANGRLEEAAEAYTASAGFLGQSGDTQMRLHVLQSLSALQLRTGRQLQALATMQSGLEGVRHPTLEQRLLIKVLDLPFKVTGR